MWSQNSVPKMTNRLDLQADIEEKLTLSTSKMTLQNGLLLIQGQTSRATKYY